MYQAGKHFAEFLADLYLYYAHQTPPGFGTTKIPSVPDCR